MVNYLFIMLMVSFITACVSTNSPKTELSKGQQAQLYLDMGDRYLQMGMLTTAKEKLEIAEKIDSGNSNIQNGLAALYEQMKLYSEAKKHYQKAVALDDGNFGAKNNYGRFLCENGDYDSGIKLLNEALRFPLNNRRWFAYTNIGLCELMKGKLKEAEFNFRNALQINKNYAPALFEMQKISYHAAKYMSARAFLQRYLAVSKHNAETLWYAVQTERALGDIKTAEGYKNKLLSLFPVSKEAQQLRLE